MGRKIIEINLEISETMYKYIEVFSKLNDISLSEAFTRLLNSGISQGAESLELALLKGASTEQQTLEKISTINRLSKVGNSPILPANEVNESLRPNIEMIRDDDLIESITKKLNNSHTD